MISMRIVGVVTLVTLTFTLKYVSAGDDDLYEVPIPEIEVFTTGGLRISIPEENGISLFRFHGNINKDIDPLGQGTLNLETDQQSFKGRWVLEIRNPLLKRGDIIYYWIFVKKDRLGYVRQPQSHKVTERVPYYILPNIPSGFPHSPPGQIPPIPSPSTTKPPFYYPTAPSQNFPVPSLSTTEPPLYYPTATGVTQNNNPSRCQNKTESLTDLQNQLNALTDKVDLLIGMVGKLPNAKKLTISGRIPDDLNAAATVRFFLWEKLDLKPKIVSAERNNDGSITFEMETLEDKILVLKLAEENLQSSSITIF